MSQSATTPSTIDYHANRGNDPRATPPRRARGRRTGIVITLVAALLASAVLQQVAFSYRQRAVSRNRPPAARAQSRIANLDSFSLALLLGGLRGPLVMFLWTNSETQKGERDLESFDTQVELIRLLQPEFASVHLFQIWNKAYNVSVQMASLANKYSTILDAIEYGRRADRTSPNDINILHAIGGVYEHKLGSSTEKEYYRRRVRTETLPLLQVSFPAARVAEFKKAVTDAGLDESRVRVTTEGATAKANLEKLGGDRVLAAFKGPDVNVTAVARDKLRPESASGRRTEMPTLLDAQGNLLPEYLEPTVNLPADGSQGNNGAELQYLAQFQPFPYGISPIALGYNYYKRAQVLQLVGKQKHLQVSDLVIDHQPGLTLRQWSDEEWDRGRRLEQRAFAATPPEKTPRELRTSKLALDAKVADRAALDEAIASYERASQTAAAALPEFAEHVKRYSNALSQYPMHRDTAQAVQHLTAGDAKYLRALVTTTPEQRKGLLDQAKGEYQQAQRWFNILMLGFFVHPRDARALGYTPDKLPGMTLEQLQDLRKRFDQRVETVYKGLNNTQNASDIREYRENLQRIQDRLDQIK